MCSCSSAAFFKLFKLSTINKRSYLTANKVKYSFDLPNKLDKLDDKSIKICDSPTASHLNVLKSKFKLNTFKPLQWRIIRSILEDKKDNFVILPAGYGKSLCYQYPAVYSQGLSIVISPLISLMQDQVRLLQILNIPSCFLGSAQTNKTDVIHKLLEGYYRLLYITPESALSNQGVKLLQRLYFEREVTLIAVDEAHCIPQWGSDFRPSYGKLSILREILPSVPVLTLTATATIQDKDVIISALNMREPQVIYDGFERYNIYFMAKKMTKEPFGDISKVLNEEKNKNNIEDGSVIIYCLTKKRTESLANMLTFMGFVCKPYHAGLSSDVRKSTFDEFVTDKIKIIVATTAFGMGINKPDVRIVIHYGTPLSMDGYCQETGRAGRDGKPALCVLFYSLSDFVTHRFLGEHRKSMFPFNNTSIKPSETNTSLMKKYISLNSCRRDFIILYFDKMYLPMISFENQCCDNCTNSKSNESNILYDCTEDVKLFLKTIQSFYPKTFGVNKIISALLGSTANKEMLNYYENKLFGAGKKKNKDWWKHIAFYLETENYITLQNKVVGKAFYSKVRLDVKGEKWLIDNTNGVNLPIILILTNDLQRLLENK